MTPDEMNFIELAYASIDKIPEQHPTVAAPTVRLWEIIEDHVELLEELTASKVEESRVLDAVVIATLLRSHATVMAFLAMIEQRNKYCAVAMTRFQLDSTMRLFACTLAEDHVHFVSHILDGGMPDKFKTKARQAHDRQAPACGTLCHLLGDERRLRRHERIRPSLKSASAGVFDSRKSKPGKLVFSEPTSLVYWDEPQMQATMVRFIWATSCLLHLCFSLHEGKNRPSSSR